MSETIKRLEAESDIRRLLATYTDAVYREDVPAYAACWAKDASWHSFGRCTRGREAITAWWQLLASNFSPTWHFYHTIILQTDGNTAKSRVYCNEVTRGKDGKVLGATGIYHDQYIIEDGAWRFALRHWDLVYVGPPDFSGWFCDKPVFGSPPHDPDPNRQNKPSLEEIQKRLAAIA